MIEEIKREIFTEKYIIHDTYINLDVIGVNDLKKVLDKYKNQEPTIKTNDKGVFIPVEVQELIKYKNVWEELLKQQKENEKKCVNVGSCLELMQELEQKHGIKESK